MHSPSGCQRRVNHVWAHHDSMWNGGRVFVSNIKENDAIFGSSEKVIPLVELAESQYNAPLYFILSSCAPNIVGDDLDSVALSLQTQLRKPVIHLPSPGFGGDFIVGFRHALIDTLKHLVKTRFIVKQDFEKDSVNIIGYMFNRYENDQFSDIQEIERLLTPLGLKINCIVNSGEDASSLAKFSRAEYNISFLESPELSDFLQIELGQKHILVDYPVGLDATERFLMKIASQTNRNEKSTAFVEKSLGKIIPLINSLIDELTGKKMALFANSLQIVGLVELVCDLGIEPVIIGITDSSRSDIVEDLRDLVTKFNPAFLPVILLDPDRNNTKSALKQQNVDFVLGSMVEVWDAEGLGIPGYEITFPMFDKRSLSNRPILGYQGVLHLVEEMGNFFEKSSLMRKELSQRLIDIKAERTWYST